MIRRTLPLAAATAAAAVLLAACGGSSGSTTGAPAAPAAPAGGPLDLSKDCPATVVMQQDWQPEAEHGAMYSLVGAGYSVDTNAKSVTGPLVTQGVDTGVKVEVRAGGPNKGFQPVPALMYLDDSITVGAVSTSDALNAPNQPTVAVASQMTKSPQMLMWDPATYPGAKTIKEVAAKGATVVTSNGGVIPALLEAQEIMQPAQSDTSYEGTPARFVSDPKIMQQGFATAEPFIYQNEIAQWKKPVASEDLANYGYSIYPEALAVRADKVQALSPCLKKLVPIMQRAQIDFLKNPTPTNKLIVSIVDQYQTGWTYSEGVADFSAKTQVSGGYVTNDPASGVFGQFDPARMQKIVDTFAPILKNQGTSKTPPDPKTLYTNEFIDPSIKMGATP